ncbi:MAG: phage major capsid protein [Candidatus Coproplasma sp.]
MIRISDAENVLKTYYLDVINEQLNAEISPFYNAIAKTSENVFGKRARLAIAKNNMCAVRACSEDEDLPAPHANRYYYIEETLKNIYGKIEISDKAIRSSSDSSGSLVNILNAEMNGLIEGAKANLARMLYGNGNGVVTKIISKVSTYVLQVEDVKPYLLNNAIDIQLSSSTITTTVTKMDRKANTITVNTNLDSYTISGGELILISGVSGKELKGLAYIFDDTYCYGYNKASVPTFCPYVMEMSRSELSEDDLIKMVDEIEEYGGGKVNMILCSHNTRRLITKLFASSKHIVNSTDIQAGFTNIFVDTVPVYADVFCPEGRIYFLNTDDFILCQLCDWSWLENEDGRILTQVPGKAAFSATLVKYAELICRRPCGQGLIKLTD